MTGTVTLDGPAPTGGATVTLTSSNTTAATVPPNVSIAAGTTSNTFTVTTLTVTATKTSNITASYGGVGKSVTLTVTPTAVLYSLTLSPTSVVGGNPSTGTVTLNGNAPTGGATVTLSSSNTAVATVPANVVVSVGTSSNTFTVTTVPVFASSSATITATYSGSKTATLTVTPNVAFLMNRDDETLLASASGEPEEVGSDEVQANEEIIPAPTAETPQGKAPTFKLASLWTLGSSPNADLFHLRPRPDLEPNSVSDSSEDGDALLPTRFRNLRFSSLLAGSAVSHARTALTTTGARYFFYTPDMNLMAETELTSNPTPLVLYEYIWFGGQPVAQVDSAGTTSWTFTDHLGTPIIQTSSAQGITWRAEHEPYGTVFALRTPDQHQPLRLPGQEAEQLNLGPNGATERSHNIFRWYRNGWGRYTQADPIGLNGGSNLYSYALENPLTVFDSTGLAPCTKNPALADCGNPDSTCCVAKCIDDLRFSLCQKNNVEPGLQLIGAAGGVGTGIKIGGEIGLQVGGPQGLVTGACIGAVAGGVAGFYGLWMSYHGMQWQIQKAGVKLGFKNCMEKTCGYACKPGTPCLIERIFSEETR